MTKQAKQAYLASTPSEPLTSYSPRNEGSHKGMSQVHLDGTQYMTYFYELLPSNVAKSRTQQHKPSPKRTTSYR